MTGEATRFARAHDEVKVTELKNFLVVVVLVVMIIISSSELFLFDELERRQEMPPCQDFELFSLLSPYRPLPSPYRLLTSTSFMANSQRFHNSLHYKLH
jgi:hypothetical protein